MPTEYLLSILSIRFVSVGVKEAMELLREFFQFYRLDSSIGVRGCVAVGYVGAFNSID